MKSPSELIKALVKGAKRELNRSIEEELLCKQIREIQARINNLDSLLQKERSSLIEAYNAEEDPVRRYQIMSGIKEIEAILNKRRRLETYNKSPESEMK